MNSNFNIIPIFWQTKYLTLEMEPYNFLRIFCLDFGNLSLISYKKCVVMTFHVVLFFSISVIFYYSFLQSGGWFNLCITARQFQEAKVIP